MKICCFTYSVTLSKIAVEFPLKDTVMIIIMTFITGNLLSRILLFKCTLGGWEWMKLTSSSVVTQLWSSVAKLNSANFQGN